MTYKLYNILDPKGQTVIATGVMTVGADPAKSFLMDEANPDYQAYLAWLAEGNEPLPADEPSTHSN